MITPTSAKLVAIGLAGALAGAAPAYAAADFAPQIVSPAVAMTGAVVDAVESGDNWQHGRSTYNRRDRDRNYGRASYNSEPVYANSQVWRGNDGRYYCRRSNGTTGLIIGGAAGALLGREVDGGYNRTTGTILGAAAGALLGREVDRGRSRCR